jgi:hypothetical protein
VEPPGGESGNIEHTWGMYNKPTGCSTPAYGALHKQTSKKRRNCVYMHTNITTILFLLYYRAFLLSIHKMTNKCIQFFISLVFCFYMFRHMPSSASLCVPSKLLAHLRLSWVKSARLMEVDYCLRPRCVAICWQHVSPHTSRQ